MCLPAPHVFWRYIPEPVIPAVVKIPGMDAIGKPIGLVLILAAACVVFMLLLVIVWPRPLHGTTTITRGNRAAASCHRGKEYCAPLSWRCPARARRPP